MNLKQKIWSRVRSEVAGPAREWLKSFLTHQAYWIELDEKHVLPGAATAQIQAIERGEIGHLSADELLERADTLSALRRIEENPSVQATAQRNLNALFLNTKQPIATLAAAVEKSLAAQIAELKSAETDFFAGYGLPYEQTSVTRAAIAEQSAFAAKIKHFDFVCESLAKNPTGQGIAAFDFQNLAALFETVAN